MATLVPCRDCGYEVSTSSSQCPRCGRNWPGSKDKEKFAYSFGCGLSIGLVILAILMFLFL